MKKSIAVLLVMGLVFGLSGVAQAGVFQDGGDRLTNLQQDDGGWVARPA